MRLHEFTVALISKKNEIIGKDVIDPIDAKLTIDLDKIVSFRQAFSEECDEENDKIGKETLVYLIDGENFIIEIPYESFSKIMLKQTEFDEKLMD